MEVQFGLGYPGPDGLGGFQGGVPLVGKLLMSASLVGGYTTDQEMGGLGRIGKTFAFHNK